MKFMHLSDLHLGKRVNEFSMIEDQEYILTKIINIIDDEKVHGVIIAGDVFDRSMPSEEAVRLWDDFLNRLAMRRLQVFVISGNHDSSVRLSANGRLIECSGIHIAPVYTGEVTPIVMENGTDRINIYMLPFIKPVTVRQCFPDEKIDNYTDACRVAIDRMNVDTNDTNILVAHQFVAGAVTCDSEEIVVGGLDNVDPSVFDIFDYVALGHIHGKQRAGKDTIRYCGTPLKYSFSEMNHIKSATIVEVNNKEIDIREIPLVPKRDLRQIKGTYDYLTAKENYQDTAVDDYLQVVLTDEDDILDAMGKLRVIYPNIMKLSYDNKRSSLNQHVEESKDIENKTPLELFEELFMLQNNQEMSEEQRKFTEDLMESIGGRSL